jgi:hypothetical protein
MKKFIVVIIVVIGIGQYALNIQAQNYIRNTSVIDTPTAYTLGRGTYQLSMLGYDEGGLEFKAAIGLTDYIFLGASFDIEHAIGRNKAEPNNPGVIAKLKFTDGWERFPISLAIGYDSFYYGSESRAQNNRAEEDEEGSNFSSDDFNRVIYGPYVVITKPIYLFDDEQHISVGYRIPTQPDYVPEDSSYFVSLDIPLGQHFILKGEMERIYYNFERNDEWLYNAGIRYTVANLGIEFDFMKQKNERVNRVIRVEYRNEF